MAVFFSDDEIGAAFDFNDSGALTTECALMGVDLAVAPGRDLELK